MNHYKVNVDYKLDTKKSLLELLEKYKCILTKEMLDYLKSLIELEYSVIREYIGDDDRKALSELEIYKRIAIYNIYRRAFNLFNKIKMPLIVGGNNNFESLRVSYIDSLYVSYYLDDRCINLFKFNYGEYLSMNNKIPYGYKAMKIGDISLYHTLLNKELRESELDGVMKILERLYDEKNPYYFRSGAVGGSAVTWEVDHAKKIQKYEEQFKQLNSKKELSDDDKKEIEVSNKVYNMLLEDYGLSDNDFEEQNQIFINKNAQNRLSKKLVNEQPNLSIISNIKYI